MMAKDDVVIQFRKPSATDKPDPNKSVRERGRIQAIVNSVNDEKDAFFVSDYCARFPQATVQSVFSILKACGYIISIAQTGQRGKYIRRDTYEQSQLESMKSEIVKLKDENKRLESMLSIV